MSDSEVAAPTPQTGGCGLLGRYPVISVVSFAAVGLATGVGLSFWVPEDEAGETAKDTTLQWIGLIGDLFIRALTCVVLPMVFVTVALSMVDMITAGKASAIGYKTIGMYLLTTVIASILGLISTLSFMRFFQEGDIAGVGPSYVSLGCNAANSLLTESSDGTVACSTNFSEESSRFILADLSGSLVTKSGGLTDDLTLSDTIYSGVFMKLVTNNIIRSFTDGNFAAVVFFAIFFGIALAKQMMLEKKETNNGAMLTLVAVFKETEAILVRIILWIIALTPFAIFSLIAKAVGSQTDLAKEFANVGWLMAAAIVGFVLHFIVVDVCLLGFMTKKNPFSYLKFIVPAQTTAFASASSAATLPVTLKCAQQSGVVPDAIGHFVIPLGATINMDGSAIYIPCCCIWLAVLNGITPNVGQYVLLIILATVGSAGAAPVPSASIVLMITAYNTVFNATGTPLGLSFIMAVDWFVDRLRTVLNVTGDSVVAAIVSATTPLEEVQDLDMDMEQTDSPAQEQAEYVKEVSDAEMTNEKKEVSAEDDANPNFAA
jgi:Na+/H+-dicarboxylate symporter